MQHESFAHTSAIERRTNRRTAVLVWMPLVAVIAIGLLAAAGLRLSDRAVAASSSPVVVTATVDPLLEVDMTNCGGPLTWPANISAGNGVEETNTACEVAFRTTNSPNGANLQVRNARSAQASFFCHNVANPTPLDCAANEAFANLATNPSDGSDFDSDPGAIAMRIHSPAGGAVADWDPDDPSTDASWNNIPAYAAAQTACHSTAATTTWSICEVIVGAHTAPAYLTGAYQGELEFIATQR